MGGKSMDPIKKKSIKSLSKGLEKFEESRNAVKNSDFTDLRSFMKDFLNTPESKQRKKLADEFLERHHELYMFIRENKELIKNETEISEIISSAVSGESRDKGGSVLTNLLEIIEGAEK